MDLGERLNPASASDLRKTLVEPLNDARTPLADFPSILLGGLALCAKLGGQVFIDRLAMADGDEANDPRLAVDRVDDSKTADTILPQAVEFAHEGLPTLRIDRNVTNSRFDGAFQVGMERPDYLSHMRRDIGTEGIHAVRRFLAGVNGSPNTSSKESPFFAAL